MRAKKRRWEELEVGGETDLVARTIAIDLVFAVGTVFELVADRLAQNALAAGGACVLGQRARRSGCRAQCDRSGWGGTMEVTFSFTCTYTQTILRANTSIDKTRVTQTKP